jgi:hypothetical protein
VKSTLAGTLVPELTFLTHPPKQDAIAMPAPLNPINDKNSFLFICSIIYFKNFKTSLYERLKKFFRYDVLPINSKPAFPGFLNCLPNTFRVDVGVKREGWVGRSKCFVNDHYNKNGGFFLTLTRVWKYEIRRGK